MVCKRCLKALTAARGVLPRGSQLQSLLGAFLAHWDPVDPGLFGAGEPYEVLERAAAALRELELLDAPELPQGHDPAALARDLVKMAGNLRVLLRNGMSGNDLLVDP